MKSHFKKWMLVSLVLFFPLLGFTADNQLSEKEKSDGWILMFDGKSFENWKIDKWNANCFKIEDNSIKCYGKPSMVYYNAPENVYKDFHFVADVMTKKGANSGIFFHTKYQDKGWPRGHEAQVNCTQRDPVKTGSVYIVKKYMKQAHKDDQWFHYEIIVRGKTVITKVNGEVVVTYKEGDAKGSRKLSSGTFGLQAHDPGSIVFYKNIKVKALSAATMNRAEKAKSLDLRAMTFNIRNGRAKDGENRWELRKEFVCDVIRDYAPDVLGVQEAFRFQLDEFNKRLPEYGEVGIGRDGASKGEYTSILYLKKRFDVDESGTFWLSDTPTKPSAHWGNRYRRVCSWARLIDKKSARAFYVYNTHMDHESQRARENGAQLIMKTIMARTQPDPFILMGDFNASESNPVITYLKGDGKLAEQSPIPVVDSWRIMHPNEKVAGTSNRFNGYLGSSKIDYIFVMPGTHVSKASIVRTNRDGRWPSDHYPVTAELSLRKSTQRTK
jgi:endonuclease/exonuclease/phosphatase family metal-dependent hydrolase